MSRPHTATLSTERDGVRRRVCAPPSPPALDLGALGGRFRAPVDEATREGLRALHASHPLRALAAAAGLGASTVLRALRGGAVSSHAREALGALVRAVPSNPAGQRAA